MGDLVRCSLFDDLDFTISEITRIEGLKELLKRSHPTDKLCSPVAAGTYLLRKMDGETEENFGVVGLNAKGFIVGNRIVSRGTATATMVSPREILKAALSMGATSCIVYHNHPSGDPDPSPEDVKLTRRIRTSGDALGIPVSDHIIVGKNKWYSFRTAEGWDRI